MIIRWRRPAHPFLVIKLVRLEIGEQVLDVDIITARGGTFRGQSRYFRNK